MKTYEKYKPSEIEWIGNIPEHWVTVSLNYRFEVQLGKMLDAKRVTGRNLAPYLRNVDIQWNKINTNDLPLMDFSDDDKEKYSIKEGDLLVCEGGEVGRCAIWFQVDIECFYQKALHRVRPLNNERESVRFLYYLMLVATKQGLFSATGNSSTIEHLPAEKLKKHRFPFPTYTEQTAIADYLDEKTAEIDKLIANKERLIKLLKEERTAIINKAVTRGINADAKLKPSGIDWLGDIPEHWVIVPLNYRFEVQLGKMLDAKRITGKKLAPYLRNVDVQWAKINTEDLPLMDFSEADKEKYSIKKGDLLICEGGEIGRCAIWTKENVECFYQKALHRVRPIDSDKDFVNFLYYLMFVASKRGLFSATGNSSTIEHLPAEKLKKHRFPFPPIKEQKEIVEFIESKTNEMDSTISKIEKEIELIKEYRTALISEVVTGKLKVVK